MNFSLNMSITLRAVANMLDTTNMMLMHWMPDFHALCEKELLERWREGWEGWMNM